MNENEEHLWGNAWIIGASTGIGKAVAEDLSPLCRTITISARSQDKLGKIASHHANMSVHEMDITDRSRVTELADKIDTEENPLDLVLISSGLWQQTEIPDLQPEIFQKAMDVNFTGVINVINAVAPQMVKRGSGHIAIIASVSGYRGLPNAAAYAPTKAALINLAECLKPQFERMGVTITIINPGFVKTPMTDVNEFPMPFIISAEEASRHIVKGLKQKKYEIAFPWKLVWPLKLMRILPNTIFFWLVRKLVLNNRK